MQFSCTSNTIPTGGNTTRTGVGKERNVARLQTPYQNVQFFSSLCRTDPCKEPQSTRGNGSMRRDDDTITCDNSPAILKPRATSYRSMPCTRANRSSAMLNYQNHLRSKYRSNCKFHFHDVKPSARLTDLEIMLFHKQVISYPPGKLTECFKCILSPFRHALFLQGAVNSVRLQQ